MAGLVAASSIVGACASLAGERVVAPQVRNGAASVQVCVNLHCGYALLELLVFD